MWSAFFVGLFEGLHQEAFTSPGIRASSDHALRRLERFMSLIEQARDKAFLFWFLGGGFNGLLGGLPGLMLEPLIEAFPGFFGSLLLVGKLAFA